MHRAVVFAVAVALLAATRAGAQPQVSDQFVRVAKQLGKRVAADELAKICAGAQESGRAVCVQITSDVAQLFAMAVDEKVDTAALAQMLVGLEAVLAQEAAAHAGQGLLQDLLSQSLHGMQSNNPGCSEGLVQAVPQLARCLVSDVLPVSKSDAGVCARLGAEFAATATSCGLSVPAPGPGQNPVGAVLHAVHGAVVKAQHDNAASDSSAYPALVALTQVQRLLSARTDMGSASAAVGEAARFYDALFATVGTVHGEHIVEGQSIDADLAALKSSGCDTAAASARLERWNKEERAQVFNRLATSLALAQEPARADLDAIPTDLPSIACSGTSAATQKALRRLTIARRSAVAYRTDVQIVSQMDRLVLPAFAAAALIDYLRTSDEQALLADLKGLLLRVLARVIATRDLKPYDCAAAAGKYTCTPVAGGAAVILALPAPVKNPDDAIGDVFEARFSPASGRHTCIYQAAAAILQEPVEGYGVCRLAVIPGFDVADTAAGKLLTRLASAQGLAQWQESTVEPLGTGKARLTLVGKLDADEAFSAIAAALDAASAMADQLPRDSPLGRLVRAAAASARLFLAHRQDEAVRSFLLVAASTLEPYLDKLLDDHLAPLTCARGSDANTLKCGVRVLVGAVYEPIVEYVAIPNPTEVDRSRLSGEAYRNLLQLDVLSRTPVLFNVGLGLTVLTRSSTSAHFTLLDKIGWAPLRFGVRNQFEAGVFAGGFLDAIVRTATSAADTTPYWLLGATLGMRSITPDLPIGIEAHVAAALPFDPAKLGDRTALAWGVAIIVPADIVFGK